jgi:DUF3014 family protein
MDDDRKKWLWYGIPIVVVLGVIAALVYGRMHRESAQQQAAVTEQTATPASSDAPTVENPITPEGDQPLPPLGESDASIHQDLVSTVGKPLDSYLVPRDIIRHIVVTVDNLPRKKTAVQLWPIKPISGTLGTSGGEDVTLSDNNYARYKPVIELLEKTDTQDIVKLYRRYYRLFQEAYVGLGYPNGYFNDRLVQVIDDVLATPEVQGPIKLTQPGVFYEFADPTLEQLSAGQKTLIRMGPDNAAIVKKKLRELRAEIARKQN